MRVFLTGGTGYIGGAVRDRLRASGHDVVALVRRPEDAARLQGRGSSAVVGDMRVPGAWTDEAAGCDAIVHAAQHRFGRRVGRRWVRQAAAADELATGALVTAAERGGRCRAFVYTSGVSAFGDHGTAWIDEGTEGRPSPIGRVHLAGERLVREAAGRGLPAVILRPGLPYGPSGTFARFFLAPAAGGAFGVVGGGRNHFPCEHLDDLAEAYALALERPPAGQVLAIVDDEPLPLADLGRLLLASFGGGRLRSAPRWVVGLLAGAPLARMLSESYRVRNARARQLLGWRPRHPTLREGLPGVVEQWLRATPPRPADWPSSASA